MSLFDGLSTPRWLGPDERNALYEREASEETQGFAGAFTHAFSQSTEYQRQLQQQQKTMDALKPVAEAFHGATTPEQSLDVLSKNPQWMANPITAPFVSKWMQTQATIARTQANSLDAKMQLKDQTDFLKRLDGVDPSDRAAIKSMTPGQGGGPSQGQWQALSLAEQTLQTKKENARNLAEVEALGRGDQQSTTISPKGEVTTRFTPAKKSAAEDLYTKAPEVIKAGDKEFLKWGHTLRELSSAAPAQKAMIDVAKHAITVLQSELARSPEKDVDAAKPGSLTSKLKSAKDELKTLIAPLPEKKDDATPAATVTTGSSGKILKYNPATDQLE